MKTELLKGKHAVLTGAGGGIGLATATAFVNHGAVCTIVDIHKDAPQAVAQLIEQFPNSVQYVKADITAMADIDNLVALAIERFGHIHVLFNNAGIAIFEKLLDSTEAAYDKLFNVNVKGLFFVMQKVLQHMVDVGTKGSVINLSSQAGRRGEALVAHYCATKAAVISYTQSAALAMAPNLIRVNAIAPGVIDTPMWEQVDAMFAKLEGLQIGEKKAKVAKEVPLGRFGFPEEIADAAVFLASDLSRYITAQTLNVDGGNVMS